MSTFLMEDASNEQELPQAWQQKDSWYSRAVTYWDSQAATVDGVLGGFGHVSPADIRESERFLLKCFGQQLKAGAANQKQQLAALDCGSGVGRIAEQLLLQHFQEVDLVEPSQHLLQKAEQNLTGARRRSFPAAHRAVNFFQMGLQDFTPEPQRYDVFWVQWCLMYLTDDDVLAWLARCSAALKPGGLIVVKENLTSGVARFEIDDQDASVARSDDYLRELFKKAELKLLYSTVQKGFDAGLLKVRMYALQPTAMM